MNNHETRQGDGNIANALIGCVVATVAAMGFFFLGFSVLYDVLPLPEAMHFFGYVFLVCGGFGTLIGACYVSTARPPR